MAKKSVLHLSRRERQIMDVVYLLGRVTVAEVLERLPDPPGYSAVRAMLRVLENKGHLRHALEGVGGSSSTAMRTSCIAMSTQASSIQPPISSRPFTLEYADLHTAPHTGPFS